MTDSPDDRTATRLERTRALGTSMYALVAGTLVHHGLALAQAPTSKTQPEHIVPAVAINLAFFGFLLWIAREARNGRRLYLASIATLGCSMMMVGGFAFAHLVLEFTGAPWLTAVQIGLALVAVVACVRAVRACAT